MMNDNYGIANQPETKYFYQRVLMSVINKEGHEKLKNMMKEEHIWECLHKCWFVDEDIKDLYSKSTYKSFGCNYEKFATGFIVHILDNNHWFYEQNVIKNNVVPKSKHYVFH